MKRLVYNLVYVLCLSVLAACATTQTVPIGTLQSSGAAYDVVLTLTNGSKLSVGKATVGPEDIRGRVRQEALRLSGYAEVWGAVHLGQLYADVTIPLSDVEGVAREIPEPGKTVILVVGIVVAGMAIGAASFAKAFEQTPIL